MAKQLLKNINVLAIWCGNKFLPTPVQKKNRKPNEGTSNIVLEEQRPNVPHRIPPGMQNTPSPPVLSCARILLYLLLFLHKAGMSHLSRKKEVDEYYPTISVGEKRQEEEGRRKKKQSVIPAAVNTPPKKGMFFTSK